MKDKRLFVIFAGVAFFMSIVFIQPGTSFGDESGLIQQHDKDGDGRVSKDEFKGSRDAFKALDKNEDGFIDRKEAAKYSSKRKESGKSEDGDDKGESKSKGKQDKPKKDGGFIEKYDSDGDGRVSKDEFKGSRDAFKNLDKNEDGYIDPSEASKGSKGKKN